MRFLNVETDFSSLSSTNSDAVAYGEELLEFDVANQFQPASRKLECALGVEAAVIQPLQQLVSLPPLSPKLIEANSSNCALTSDSQSALAQVINTFCQAALGKSQTVVEEMVEGFCYQALVALSLTLVRDWLDNRDYLPIDSGADLEACELAVATQLAIAGYVVGGDIATVIGAGGGTIAARVATRNVFEQLNYKSGED